jgi:hypothetical protein
MADEMTTLDDVEETCARALGRLEYILHAEASLRALHDPATGQARTTGVRVSGVVTLPGAGAPVHLPFTGRPDAAVLAAAAGQQPPSGRSARTGQPAGASVAPWMPDAATSCVQHLESAAGVFRAPDGDVRRWRRTRRGLAPTEAAERWLAPVVWAGQDPAPTQRLTAGQGLPRAVSAAPGPPPSSDAPLLLLPHVWAGLAPLVAASVTRGFAGAPSGDGAELVDPGVVPGSSTPAYDLEGVTPTAVVLSDRRGRQAALTTQTDTSCGAPAPGPTGHARLTDWQGLVRPQPWQLLVRGVPVLDPGDFDPSVHVVTRARWLGTQFLRASEPMHLWLETGRRTPEGLAVAPEPFQLTITARQVLESVVRASDVLGWIDGPVGTAAQLIEWRPHR